MFKDYVLMSIDVDNKMFSDNLILELSLQLCMILRISPNNLFTYLFTYCRRLYLFFLKTVMNSYLSVT